MGSTRVLGVFTIDSNYSINTFTQPLSFIIVIENIHQSITTLLQFEKNINGLYIITPWFLYNPIIH